VTFFEEHFKRDDNGKILLDPDNAIETYWKVRNPLPDIAGLKWVRTRLLERRPGVPPSSPQWMLDDMLKDVPDLPMTTQGGTPVLAPFQSANDATVHNSENPELYAIFPFRHFGMGKPGLDLARNTFVARRVKGTGCWQQDAIQAAYLGDTETARKDVLINFTAQSKQMRFPAFWESGSDYTPDEDNGGNAMLALQLMLMQCEGKRILLLPAWPKECNASFKLHAPMQTVVEAKVRGGKIEDLKVTPDSRRADVEVIP
jgi:alpha-L-fucosidase 2